MERGGEVQVGRAGLPLPFVIVGRRDQIENSFASLADAVAEAQNGDVIEVRRIYGPEDFGPA